MIAGIVRPRVLVRLLALLALLIALGGVAASSVAADETADDPEKADGQATASLVGADPVDFPGEVGRIVQNTTDLLVPTRRYRGEQRFDTARLIALDAFDDPDRVVIARGDLFPDALSGSYLAGQLGAPILLTSSHRLEPATLDALQRLTPDEVVLMGGTSAISFGVAVELNSEGFTVRRVGGADRFETAALAATAEGTAVGERDGHGRTAIVARADEFADALVAGALSYTADFPLLLTTGDRLHPDAADALEQLAIDHVIVPGGEAAVSEAVVGEMEAAGVDVERIAGVDRVATSVAFAQFMRDELGFGLDRINTAIGTRFPDALALGPLSGPAGQPIVLTANERTLGGGGAVENFLAQTCVVDLAGLAGGHAAITTALEDDIRGLATSTGAPCNLSLEPTVAARDLGADHTLTGRLTDNADQPVAGEDVRIEVYRADLDLSAGEASNLDLSGLSGIDPDQSVEELLTAVDDAVTEVNLDAAFGESPVETFTATTDQSGEVSATYTGPEQPALDVAVACHGDEAESCALLTGGEVTANADALTATAVTLWAAAPDLVPNLLLAEPPLAVTDSGGSHAVTATALDADLDAAGDLGSVTDPSSIDQLGDLADVDPDQLGERVPDTDVRFEVYRSSDLPGDLLDQVRTALEADDPQAALSDLLESVDAQAALDAVGAEPVHTGVETTGADGEATFTYDGPAGGEIGLDLVVACFDSGFDRCTTLAGGDLQLPGQPGTAAAAALWAPDLSLANLLLAQPPLATETSGGDHDVTATALDADLSALGGDVRTASSDTVADLVSDAGLNPDDVGERVAGEEVRFEVYRASTELPQSLLDDVQALLSSDPADLEDQLTDLLGSEDADAVLSALATDPIATATEVTDDVGEATFAYDGPPAHATGADLVVACLESGDQCTSVVDGDLQVADEPGVAAAASLWVPALLDLDPLAEVGAAGGDHSVTATATRADGEPGSDLPVRFEVWRADGDVDALVQDLADLADLDLTQATDLQGLLDAADDLSEDDLLTVLDPETLRDAGLTKVTDGVRTTDGAGEATFGYSGPAETSAVDVVVACPGEPSCGALEGGVLQTDETRVPALGSMLWIQPDLAVDTLALDPIADVGKAESGAGHQVTATAESLRFDDGGTALPDKNVRFEVYRTTDGQLLEDIATAIQNHDAIDLSLVSDVDDLLAQLDDLSDSELASLIDQGVFDAAFDARVAEGTVTTDSSGEATFAYDGPASNDAVDVITACPADGSDCATLSSGSLQLDADVLATATMLWLHPEGTIADLLGLLDGGGTL